jgi:hypothetical protein
LFLAVMPLDPPSVVVFDVVYSLLRSKIEFPLF